MNLECEIQYMDATSYTVAQTEFAKMLDRVNDNQESIIITRNGKASAVILSLAEYESLQKTAARRLDKSIAEIEANRGIQVTA